MVMPDQSAPSFRVLISDMQALKSNASLRAFATIGIWGHLGTLAQKKEMTRSLHVPNQMRLMERGHFVAGCLHT
jgi:hypothetical protein